VYDKIMKRPSKSHETIPLKPEPPKPHQHKDAAPELDPMARPREREAINFTAHAIKFF
jgi:hypothetical protein